MKKLLAVLAVAVALPAAAIDTVPSHVVQELALGTISPAMLIEPISFSALTTAETRNRATLTFDTGTQSAPSASDKTSGIALTGVEYIRLQLVTSNTASTGTLQCYIRNDFDGNWDRYPAWDVTAIAATRQGWAPISVGVRNGRAVWVPTGIGTVTGAVYITAQAR